MPLFGVGALLVLVRRGDWRRLGIVLGVLAALAVSGFAAFPDALPAMFVGVGRSAASRESFSTTWSLARDLAGSGSWLVGWLLAGAAALACAAAVRWAPPPFVPWALPAASLVLWLAVSPYVRLYDQVLLAPAALVAVLAADAARGLARAVHLTPVVVAVLFVPWAALLLQVGSSSLGPNGVAPLACAGLLAASGRVPRAAAVSR